MNIQVFDNQWFKRHQRKLLFLLNFPVTKKWFRSLLMVREKEIKINEIGSQFFRVKLNENTYRATFNTENVYSKRLYEILYPVWMAMHVWDLAVDKVAPSLSFGFSTLTAFPTAGTGGPSGSCNFSRDSVNETFGTIRAGAATTNYAGSATAPQASLFASSTSNQFAEIHRFGMTFDTSSIGASSAISSAILSLYGRLKQNGLGANSADIVSWAPSVNFNFVTSDGNPGNFGTTSYANIVYASWSTSAYNDHTLDSNGRGNISKTSISKFGWRSNWDLNNSFGGVWASGAAMSQNCFSADQAGTSNDPQLVVTYTVAVTLTASVGAYTLTGSTANLVKAMKMTAAVGTYTLTGIAATLKTGYGLIAGTGSYAVTGVSVNLTKAMRMTAATGSYILTGINVTMTFISNLKRIKPFAKIFKPRPISAKLKQK